MRVIKTEPIVKKYYDALEAGKVLGRKCTKCGHIEFPPYLACNECGNLDTEWVDLTNTRAHVRQILRPLKVFPEHQFADAHGGYMPIAVQIDHADPYVTSLVQADPDRYDELHDNLENVIVKPYIAQNEDTKIVLWTLEDYDGPDERNMTARRQKQEEEETSPAAEQAAAPAKIDKETADKMIACVAEAYEKDPSEITLDTRVREDLSGESIKLILLLSNIEDAFDVSIEITDASDLNTVGDFMKAVKERM